MTLDKAAERPAPAATAFSDVAGVLDTAAFYRLRSTPQRPREPDRPDPVPAQLFAALTAAHSDLSDSSHGPGLLAAAWQRLPGETAVQVLLGGGPTFTPVPGGAKVGDVVPVLYPPGSLGELVHTSDVLHAWRKLPAWVVCVGQPDALWTSTDATPAEQHLRGGFDDYVAYLGDAFVWLVLAQPLTATQLTAEVQVLHQSIPRLRRQENNAASQIDLLRAERRYRELTRARASGVWRLRVAIGADTPPAAQRAAALLCSSSDLASQPYTLAPGQPPRSFHDALTATIDPTGTGMASPFTATTELLAALTRPPKRELPGIRLIEPPEFDLTPEHDSRPGDIHVGAVLDAADRPIGEFAVTRDTLNRHTFVAGATGAGKSQTIRHLLEQLHRAGVPWLVVEPAKAEYAGMAGRIGVDNLTVLHPGDPDAVPYGLNPLQPEPGFPLQTHIDLLRALFLAAFEPAEPFPQVLSQALDRCYRDLGWDPVVGASRLRSITPRYPRLGDLHRTALAVVEGIGYGREVADNIRGFVDVRIRSLQLGTPGRFFDGRYPLDIADLLNRNVVLEIEDIGTDVDKAFLIGAVLIRIVENLRVRQRHAEPLSGGLKHVTVVEEAHRLLKRSEPGSTTAHAVELFTALLAEIRAYGEGMVIAEQIPNKIVSDVVKNTALKIVHRLPAADDRDAVGATMNLDRGQSRHVVSLPPGRAVVFADGMDRPVRVEIPYAEAWESTPSRLTDCGPADITGQDEHAPLTARELAVAERLSGDPHVVLWLELLTVAHLVGQPAPRPDREWLDGLIGQHPRPILHEAIAHRIQRAIDSRYVGLGAYYQPEALLSHLTLAALDTLDDTAIVCDGGELEWRAGQYRWADVATALGTALKDPAFVADRPHPDTQAWASRGLRLAGGTLEEQCDAYDAHPDNWRPDLPTIAGTEMPSAFDDAVSQLSPAGVPEDRITHAAAFLGLTTAWPVETFGALTNVEGEPGGK